MDRLWDFLLLALYVAIVFLLVRPGSQGPALVNTVSTGITNLVSGVTGGGGWRGNK